MRTYFNESHKKCSEACQQEVAEMSKQPLSEEQFRAQIDRNREASIRRANHPTAQTTYASGLICKPKSPFELFGIEVHKGWWPLVEPIYKRIQELNAAGANIEITQIKEKFGALRFYTHNTPEGIDAMIKKAQEQSIHICEDCGAPAERVIGNYKWIYTLCPSCLKKRGITIVETPEEADARRRRKQARPESESSAKTDLP